MRRRSIISKSFGNRRGVAFKLIEPSSLVKRQLAIRGKLNGLFHAPNESVTNEIVFNVYRGGRWLFDTLVVEENGFRNDIVISERRYMAEGGYAIHLAAHNKGTRGYHTLLQEVKT